MGVFREDVPSLLLPKTVRLPLTQTGLPSLTGTHRYFSQPFVSDSLCAPDDECTYSGKKGNNFPRINLTIK